MGIPELVAKRRNDILRIAAKHGVTRIRVFGSVARGEAGPKSDVDFLIEVVASVAMSGAARDTYLNAQRKAYTAARSDAFTTRQLASRNSTTNGTAARTSSTLKPRCDTVYGVASV